MLVHVVTAAAAPRSARPRASVGRRSPDSSPRSRSADRRVAGVGGASATTHLEPQHADLRGPDRAAGRLGDDRRRRPACRRARTPTRRCPCTPPRRRTAARPARAARAEAAQAATAPTIAARPAFMSPAPRPYSQSPSRRGSNGGEDHSDVGPGPTTSTWPLRISDRPAAAGPGPRSATTLRLAVDVPAERRRRRAGAGPRRPAAHRPGRARVPRTPAHDLLAGGLGAEQRRRARRGHRAAPRSPRPAATASRTAPSSGRAAPIDEGLGVGPGGEVRERLAPREARPAVLDPALGREVRGGVDGAEAVGVAVLCRGGSRKPSTNAVAVDDRGRRRGRAGSARARRCGSRGRTRAIPPGPGGSSSPGSG